MTAKDKLKTSYDFSPRAKGKLMKLKMDLKLKGLTGVSESSILEALIDAAKLIELEALFKKRQRG